ncbi:MAG: cellulase family glycosylhydrolase [Armatimonadota bacterium]
MLNLNRKPTSALSLSALLAAALALSPVPALAAPQAAPASAAASGPATPSLIANGSFETDADKNQWPDGWSKPADSVQWAEESGGNRFLRLISVRPGQTVLLYRAVSLPPAAKALKLSWRWRATDLKPGKEAWFDARILLSFKDAAGKKMGKDPAAPYLRASTEGWREGTARIAVPEGARSLELMPSLFQVEKGTLDLDNLSVEVIGATDLASAAAPGQGKPPATKAAVKAEAMVPEAPQPAKWPKELRVVGNQVQTGDGKPIWLQGLNVVSLEWSVKGESVLRSTQVAIDDWKSGIIRLPVKEEYWFGKSAGQKDGGTAYRALVDDVVTIAANRGAYILLDLHRFRAPREEHVAFWKDAATHYKNHPAVLFDLFNEPHGVSWKVWRDGGFVPDKETPADEDAFLSAQDKTKSSQGFQSPGMQRMVDTVRETGARNIVVAGGLDWSYDLTGIANGFALKDATGNGIIYATHIYPWKSGWKDKVLIIAEKHPILVGEVGADIKKLSFVPLDRQEDPYTWSPDLLGFIQKHRLHWTAFSFHPSASPVMISGWDYSPTPFWGSFVKAALRGSQFGMNRMR